jgi:hypothetical protein
MNNGSDQLFSRGLNFSSNNSTEFEMKCQMNKFKYDAMVI